MSGFSNAVATPKRKSGVKSKEKSEDLRESPWQVLVLDDPVNLMEYVTRVLMKVFSYHRPLAEKMMMEVHEKGRSIVWNGAREKAEMYVQQLQRAQLKALIEKGDES